MANLAATVKRRTRAERAAARRSMANMIAAGHTLAETAEAHGVSTQTVWSACREHGVATPSYSRQTIGRALRVVARWIDGMTPREAGNAEGMSRQHAHWVCRLAREAGIRRREQ